MSINTYKQKPPYDTLFWVARRPGVIFAENLWEEFVFEVLLGLNFSFQPNTGLGATKQRHPEKAGNIVRASSKFYSHRWFLVSAVAVLVQFSVWKGKTPNPP